MVKAWVGAASRAPLHVRAGLLRDALPPTAVSLHSSRRQSVSPKYHNEQEHCCLFNIRVDSQRGICRVSAHRVSHASH